MGRRLYDQDGYPPGVDNSHPHFHRGDDPLCVCGHGHDLHSADGWGCVADGCWCDSYEAEQPAERDEDSYPERDR